MHREQAENLLGTLTGYYGRRLTDEAKKWWLKMLEPLDYNDAREAVEDYCSENAVFPSLARVRRDIYALRRLRMEAASADREVKKVNEWELEFGRKVCPFFMKLLRKEPGYTVENFANDCAGIARVQGCYDKIDWPAWENELGIKIAL